MRFGRKFVIVAAAAVLAASAFPHSTIAADLGLIAPAPSASGGCAELVLSCEKAAEGEADLVLRPTMRYAHGRAAVEAACKAAGYAEVEIEDLVLREEDQKAVEGFLVVARKAS